MSAAEELNEANQRLVATQHAPDWQTAVHELRCAINHVMRAMQKLEERKRR